MSFVTYKAAGQAASPSDSIWGDCPVLDWMKNPGKGFHLWEDFEGGCTVDEVAQYKFALAGDAPDIDPLTTEHSVVELTAPGAANQCVLLKSNILYELKKNSGKRMWLEARFKLLDSNAEQGMIFGLGEDSMLLDGAIADGGTAIGDYDFIGFAALASGDGSAMEDIDSVYHEAGDGGAPTVIQADIVDIDGTTQDNTYWKLGMKFDGKETVTFYLNGEKCTTTFDPDDFDTGDQLTEDLGVVLGILWDADTSASDQMKVDWIRFACDKYSHGHGV